MDLAASFSPDYATAKNRFLEAIRHLGYRHESHELSAQGPNGEPLTMDVAMCGSPNAERAVVVSSGLHGVEGFFGSAVQLAWLQTHGTVWSPPPHTALILARALNPFGFAWLRRWNENNVDLNRNFLDDRSILTDDPGYEESHAAYLRLASFLNPQSPPSRWEPYTVKAIHRVLCEGYGARARLPKEERPSFLALRAVFRLGLLELKKTSPVGQYEVPTGLFYGGAGAEETTLVLWDRLPVWVKDAELVLHLDYHTGLGGYADYRLLTKDEKGSARQRWQATHFGEGNVESLGGEIAAPVRGALPTFFRDRLSGKQYHGLTAEFGTYSPLRVLGALRAENRAHFFDTRDSRSYRWAKQQLLEAFCPADRAWREAVVAKGVALIEQAAKVCFDPCPGACPGISAGGTSAI
jgi:hypothetical protein